MNMLETILGAQNGDAVRQIGAQVGLSESQTSAALAALVPALAAGLQRNARSQGGLESLIGALAGGQHSRYLENPSALRRPEAIEDGNGILGHVFGSKEVSRQVAGRAAAQTGIGADVLKQMLPMVADLVMGALARQGPATAGGPAAAAGPAGSLPGAGGAGLLGVLTQALDRDRDGSIVDDVMNLLGGLGQQGRR